MDAGTKFSVKLTNGKTLEYRIVGINHDDLADCSGKAGLTFEATNNVLGAQRMNATDSNAGGWEKSELRGRPNSGDLWALLPAEIQSKAKAVTKMTDNKGGGSAGTPSATTDKVFLLSSTEVWGGHAVRRHPVRVLQVQGRDDVELLRSFVGLLSLDSLCVSEQLHFVPLCP